MKRHLLLFFLALVSWNQLGCQECSEIGCNPAVNIEVPLPQADWSTIRSFSARLCRNSTCASGTFAGLPAIGEDGRGYGVILTGWPADEVMESFVYSPREFRISLQDGQFKNGDRYMVTVTDPEGTTVAWFDKKATYTHYGAGVDSCGMICTYATFN
jgi:hypothetical protein